MNPFTLSFGKEPKNAIRRDDQINEIIEGFNSVNPEFHVCIITGVRGSGKTVMMTEVADEIKQDKDWIVVELSPERDMLKALAAELSNRKELLQLLKDAKINLSLFGFGVEIDAEPPITDIVVALDRMLHQLTKRGKKILVNLDEALSNSNVREFASQFQIFVRKNYNIFLLMTGLFEKINVLQNENTLTFLHRAPKVKIKPLNSLLVQKQYQKIFNISDIEAKKMAAIVKGYPYAYQVLGYLCYKLQKKYDRVLEEFDSYLSEYVYDKIWSEASELDRKILIALSQSDNGKISELRSMTGFSSSKFSIYRDRLIKKGIIKSINYGHLEFTLPRFEHYITEKTIF